MGWTRQTIITSWSSRLSTGARFARRRAGCSTFGLIPDLSSCHLVLITLILAVSRVTGDGDVHPEVVCPVKCSDPRISCASRKDSIFVFVALWRPKASIGKPASCSHQLFGGNPKIHCWSVDMCTFESTFVLCAQEVLMSVMFSKTMFGVLFADWFEDWWVASVA